MRWASRIRNSRCIDPRSGLTHLKDRPTRFSVLILIISYFIAIIATWEIPSSAWADGRLYKGSIVESVVQDQLDWQQIILYWASVEQGFCIPSQVNRRWNVICIVILHRPLPTRVRWSLRECKSNKYRQRITGVEEWNFQRRLLQNDRLVTYG